MVDDELQQLVNAELPMLYLYSLTQISVIPKRVIGVEPDRLDQLDYNDALTRWSLAE